MDFDSSPYAVIRDVLAQDGIKCSVGGRHQITVSAQDRSIWPDAGNSFWITIAAGTWCLFTWMPVGYRIPDGTDLPELCRRCMAIGDRAMYRVPDKICNDFGLAELDNADVDAVYAAMATAK